MVSGIPNLQRDAIVYIPGLGEWIDHSLEGFAQRFALELRRNKRNSQAQFTIESVLEGEGTSSLPGKEVKISMRSIQRRDGDQKVALIDVYKFDYATTIAKNFERKNLLIKSLRLLLGILINIPRLFYAITGKNRPKKLNEVIQVLFGVGIISLLIIYMFSLAFAVVDTARQLPQLIPWLKNLGWSSPANLETPTLAQTLVILLALVEILVPGLRQQIEKAAVDYLGILDYLSLGERRAVITGQLDDLLRDLNDTGNYRKIHLVAFSFGSIVVLDYLFPYGGQPREGAIAVNSLVTIGLAYDLVRTFWPHYFHERQDSGDVAQRWLNIYSPIDVMASNLESTTAPDAFILTRKTINIPYNGGINSANLSRLAWLTLVGLRAHTAYWEKDSYTAPSCMKDVVVRLYQDDTILA